MENRIKSSIKTFSLWLINVTGTEMENKEENKEENKKQKKLNLLCGSNGHCPKNHLRI
jgi:hypothetical protein